MLHNKSGDRIEFRPAEAARSRENHRIQPELRDHVFPSHMNVRGSPRSSETKKKR